MSGKEIVERVIMKLDEYSPYIQEGTTLLAGGDMLDEVKPIYSYVHAHLSEAADEMLRVVPLHLLEPTQVDTPMIVDIGVDKRTGAVKKPSNYLRLHTLWMWGWHRAVHVPIHTDSPYYALQFNEWTRGSCTKPIVVEQDDRLLYFSVLSNEEHRVRVYSYIPHFDYERDYRGEVVELIALHTARKVSELMGLPNAITVLTQEINSVLENMRL